MEEEMTATLILRSVTDDDLEIFFTQQLDPEANYMAAFTAKDPSNRAAFAAHWRKIRNAPTITNRTIVVDGQVAGYVASFVQFGEREVTYWLGKEFWGKGLATRALAALLAEVTERPIYARAAKDNIASIRVLQKCGFTITGEDKGFANGRGAEVEEYILRLTEDSPRRTSTTT
jgi:RimJ/RimL family protein N-acetyltransferase